MKWAGLDIEVDTDVPEGMAEIRDEDGNIIAVLTVEELVASGAKGGGE